MSRPLCVYPVDVSDFSSGTACITRHTRPWVSSRCISTLGSLLHGLELRETIRRWTRPWLWGHECLDVCRVAQQTHLATKRKMPFRGVSRVPIKKMADKYAGASHANISTASGLLKAVLGSGGPLHACGALCPRTTSFGLLAVERSRDKGSSRCDAAREGQEPRGNDAIMIVTAFSLRGTSNYSSKFFFL